MVNIFDVLYQLVAILVPVTIIILIVYLVRSTKKRNEHLNLNKRGSDSKINMWKEFDLKNLIIGIVVLFALWFILPFFNINSSYVIPKVIEWFTKFILPWIALYWIIRLVKAFEINK